MSDRPPSVHDCLLAAYEVDGRARTIIMHLEPHGSDGEAFLDVRFDGVAAYQFEYDLLLNIVGDIAPAGPDLHASIVRDITETGWRYGFPQGWNPKAETFDQYLERLDLRLFGLWSSYGMSGWVSAKSMQHIIRSLPRDPKQRAKEIDDAIRAVLMSDWDPIGINGEPACHDEYDHYVGGVYRLLASRATPEQIADHLNRIANDMMGLDMTAHDHLGAADKLTEIDVALYSSQPRTEGDG